MVLKPNPSSLFDDRILARKLAESTYAFLMAAHTSLEMVGDSAWLNATGPDAPEWADTVLKKVVADDSEMGAFISDAELLEVKRAKVPEVRKFMLFVSPTKTRKHFLPRRE